MLPCCGETEQYHRPKLDGRRRMHWESASASDRGLVRQNNEDSILDLSDRGVFAVADGMGGHAAGEVASGIAVESLIDVWPDGGPVAEPVDPLSRTIVQANTEIRRRSQTELDKRGMGTTLTAMAIEAAGDRGLIAHVGDSRAYRFRDGTLEQLTKDHTWVQERVDAGVLSAGNARNHPYSSILTRVLGTEEEVEPDMIALTLQAGDLYLLCSDGLSGMVEDERIAGVLGADASIEDKSQQLIRAAHEGGGQDNVSAVLVRILPD
jgi:PPM family protein phosphatase